MRKLNYYPALFLAALVTFFSSCTKDVTTKSKTAASTTSTTSSGTIAIGTISDASSSNTDTLYLVNCFTPHSKPDSVAFSTLPAAIGTYLTANYSGYTFKTAFKVVDSLGATSAYIVVIKYNGNPIGLKFTATGTFVKVLEQMAGPGPGPGGHGGMNPNRPPFQGRDGMHPDTIALSALPTAVSTFFSTTYPTDTLLHASITPDSAYILISKNDGLYATAISKAGKLINRQQIPGPPGKPVSVTQANLPTAISTYLTTTYPGYVFNKAFSVSAKGVIKEYDVFITANSTNYVVVFDASGTFVKVATLH